MQKYLHISNIYCIFAARLGINPRTTVKYLYLMKGACIYKAYVNGRVYRVIEEHLQHFADVHYRIYVDRRLYSGINCFCSSEIAVMFTRALIDSKS